MRRRKTETILSSSPESTFSLARRIAVGLEPGSVLALIGPLGSGKTSFVKGLASGLGLPARAATSPTYTLIHEYGGDPPFFHVDLYRLEGPRAVSELGLEEYFEYGGVVAVEWAEKAGDCLPEKTITVCFEIRGPRLRKIVISRG